MVVVVFNPEKLAVTRQTSSLLLKWTGGGVGVREGTRTPCVSDNFKPPPLTVCACVKLRVTKQGPGCHVLGAGL